MRSVLYGNLKQIEVYKCFTTLVPVTFVNVSNFNNNISLEDSVVN